MPVHTCPHRHPPHGRHTTRPRNTRSRPWWLGAVVIGAQQPWAAQIVDELAVPCPSSIGRHRLFTSYHCSSDFALAPLYTSYAHAQSFFCSIFCHYAMFTSTQPYIFCKCPRLR
ncbi:hypothetical protein COCSADRAFT_339795 [Bipolaris sorokiniana ND90Pr]|nr:uncharacterized protein COCSADRAFT_339795 [Bipolaris sorokiniana ND90Pr]EMD63283.1 hypothetical protein COCSADRAFT_339795 [Bipolaris sorokiniana ND90Pr]